MLRNLHFLFRAMSKKYRKLFILRIAMKKNYIQKSKRSNRMLFRQEMSNKTLGICSLTVCRLSIILLIDANDDLGDECHERVLPLIGRLDDLLVIGHVVGILFQNALVGHQGEGKDVDAAMTGNQHFRDGAHACQERNTVKYPHFGGNRKVLMTF